MNIYIFIILLFILILTIVFIIDQQKIFYTIKYGGKLKTNTHNKANMVNKNNKDNVVNKDNMVNKDNVVNKKQINIVINSIPCISKLLLLDIINIIKHRHTSITNFNTMTDDDNKFYERQAHILANKFHLDFETTHLQLCSIRNLELQIYVANSKSKIKSLLPTIKKDFEKGFELTLIADKHHLPYLSTLKQLCSIYNYSQNDIKSFLRKEKPFPKELDGLNSELSSILDLDPTSYINSNKAKKHATDFENEIEKLLSSLHIEFYTENDIRKNHNSDDHESMITPDFLFKEGQNITLNEYPINWIEAKNYAYYKHKFLDQGIQQQAKKYFNKHGNGVIIFKCGVYCDNQHADGLPNVKFIGWNASHN